MIDLLLLVAGSLVLVYCSERQIGALRLTDKIIIDIPLTVMVVWICFVCGLRTNYNDTSGYIMSFQSAEPVASIIGDLELLGNPAHHLFMSFFKYHISANYHVYFLVIAFFNIISMIRLIRRHSDDFTFSMLLFFTLGLYVFNFAALKQSIAMAILNFAIEKLLKKKYLQFYLIVLLAALFHTYAVMFVILPLFTNEPWTKITYLTIGAVVVLLFAFEPVLTQVLEYADEVGKNITASHVFGTNSINLFRLAVFAVPPGLSFVFQGRLRNKMSPAMCLMVNMSILSFLVMCLGINSAGNLFGRSAIYFEIGSVIALPWIINELFDRRSASVVKIIAFACYFAFFAYDIQGFNSTYRAITFTQFLETLR